MAGPHSHEGDARTLTLATLRENIGGCREEVGSDKCWAPAEYVLWGKLFPPEALGPRCYDHAKEHVDWHGLSSRSHYALINLNDLALDLAAAVPPPGVRDQSSTEATATEAVPGDDARVSPARLPSPYDVERLARGLLRIFGAGALKDVDHTEDWSGHYLTVATSLLMELAAGSEEENRGNS